MRHAAFPPALPVDQADPPSPRNGQSAIFVRWFDPTPSRRESASGRLLAQTPSVVSTSSSPAASLPGSAGQIIVHVFGRTDVGRTREHNEDSFVVADLTTSNTTLQPEVRTHILGVRGTLFMVADGMGGAAAGELASAMAVDVVLEEVRARWLSDTTNDPENFVLALKEATNVANAKIHRYAIEHPENRGMGTTATLAGLLGDTLYLAQVGDSRAYLIRGGTARQITKDQSLMQKLIEAGEMTEEEAEQSDRRNIILQALGPEPRIRIDLTHQKIRRGDALVLCSDGLSGQVRADEIAQVVTEERELTAVCRRLIDTANENGGPDNITVVVARFEGDGLELAGAEDEVAHRAYPIDDDAATPTIPLERYVDPPRTPPRADTPLAAPLMPPARHSEHENHLKLLTVGLVLALLLLAAVATRSLWNVDAAPAEGTRPTADTPVR